MSGVLIRGGRVVTMDDAGRMHECGDVLVQDGVIAAVGERLEAAQNGESNCEVFEAAGRVVMPGFVDAHTHACWAGDRREEWERRLAGAGYLELLEAGGGIMSTVRAVRAASQDELVEGLLGRLDAMMAHGTTTAEVKSGYGLDTPSELKMLRAIVKAGEQWAGTVVPTACIGHAKDPDAVDAVRRTIDETLPAVHAEFPDIAVDAYCEQGAWSVAECATLFERALELGHPLRIHTDQFHALGMVDEAIRLGAVSVDHLEATGSEAIERIGRASADGLFAVVLPCSGFHLDERYADGRALIDAGARVVVATNCNPGSSHCVSLAMAAALGVRRCGLSSSEALAAITREGAALLGLEDRGRLEPGLRADLVVLDADDERALTHDFGGNVVERVMVGGQWAREWQNSSCQR